MGRGFRRARRDHHLRALHLARLRHAFPHGHQGLLHAARARESRRRPRRRLPGLGGLRRGHRRRTAHPRPGPAREAAGGAQAAPRGLRMVSRPAQVRQRAPLGLRHGHRADGLLDLRHQAHPRNHPLPAAPLQDLSLTRPMRRASRVRPRAAKTVALISLGCAKNLVDSEVMLGALTKAGYRLVPTPEDAEVVVVNTCGFIGPARAEAEDTLAAVVELKRADPDKTVVAAGCYVERDRPGLQAKFPEVDAWTGVR